VVCLRCSFPLPDFLDYTRAFATNVQLSAAEFGIDQCWELDALSPTVIVDLIRTAIEALIDWDRWNAALQRAKSAIANCSIASVEIVGEALAKRTFAPGSTTNSFR
jgi:hypothetical protein